ncbi:MAG: hypothetical protein ACOYKZ_07050 [Chlamydiia bacterium]
MNVISRLGGVQETTADDLSVLEQTLLQRKITEVQFGLSRLAVKTGTYRDTGLFAGKSETSNFAQLVLNSAMKAAEEAGRRLSPVGYAQALVFTCAQKANELVGRLSSMSVLTRDDQVSLQALLNIVNTKLIDAVKASVAADTGSAPQLRAALDQLFGQLIQLVSANRTGLRLEASVMKDVYQALIGVSQSWRAALPSTGSVNYTMQRAELTTSAAKCEQELSNILQKGVETGKYMHVPGQVLKKQFQPFVIEGVQDKLRPMIAQRLVLRGDLYVEEVIRTMRRIAEVLAAAETGELEKRQKMELLVKTSIPQILDALGPESGPTRRVAEEVGSETVFVPSPVIAAPPPMLKPSTRSSGTSSSTTPPSITPPSSDEGEWFEGPARGSSETPPSPKTPSSDDGWT